MQINTFMDRLNHVFSWIARLAFVNMLWMIFSAAGLFIFGFFPSTVALMTVCKKWLNGEESVPMFRVFWTSYKSSFLTSNLIGLAFVIVGIVLYLNFLVIQESGTSIVMIAAFYLAVFFVLITTTHVFPLYVYVKASFLQLLKTAFVMSLLNVHISIAILISQSAIYYLIFSYPSAALFFLGSTLSMIQMWLAGYSFKRIERKAAFVFQKEKNFPPLHETNRARNF